MDPGRADGGSAGGSPPVVGVGTRLAGRFRVERLLGEGGMGVVFEAFDEERGETVALKTLERVEARGIYGLKREFRALADVVHGNLVRLHELQCDDGRWFFTMQKIDGVPFLEHVRREVRVAAAETATLRSLEDATADAPTVPTPAGGLCEPELRAALPQLVEGVRAIHRAGKLHRDLKPSNVLVARGKVFILDFGLAQSIEPGADRSAELGAAGTPAYMAPEQLRPDGACPASDWYALGVMLYQALTGTFPFSGSTYEVIAAKQTGKAPPSPHELAPGTPDDLAALCMALLAHEPSARPTEGAIAEVVGEAPAGSEPTPPTDSNAAPFVGRDAELEVVRAAYRAVRGGEPALVSVQGESGIGKSALVARFIHEIRGEAVVLSGRCYERESVPFKALDAVVDALSRHLRRVSRVDAAKLTPRYAGELCRVFPVLGQVPPFADEKSTTTEPQELRRRAFAALKELFSRMAARRPLVVAIDDLQWGDADSSALLSHLLEPPEPPPILWLASYRKGELAASAVLPAMLDGARRGHELLVRKLALEPLPAADARALARELLGDSGTTPTSDLAGAIAEEAAGSPFFIGELARRARAGERGGKEPGVTMADLIEARVAALSPEARSLVEAVAIAGRPIPLAVAIAAAGLVNDEAVPGLRAASLVRASGPSAIEAYHDRIRETVAASMSKKERRRLHARLASALEEEGTATAEMLAHHHREAGKRKRARRYAVVAAQRAVASAAFGRAADLYRMALSLTVGDEAAMRGLERALGDALASAGRGVEAADAYLRAAATAPAEEVLALERRAAHQLLVTGHMQRGLEVARVAMARVGVRLPESVLVALIISLLRIAYLYVVGVRVRLRSEAQMAPADLERCDLEQTIYEGLALSETVRGSYFGIRSIRSSLRLGDRRRIATALGGMVPMVGGLEAAWQSRVQSWLRTQEELADELGEPQDLAIATLARGCYAFCRGRWAHARGALQEAERVLLQCEGVSWHASTAQAFHTWTLFYVGAFRELSERAPKLVAESKAKNNAIAANAAGSAFGVVAWLARDDLEGGRREVDDAARRWPTEGFQLQHYWLLLAWSFVALYGGDALRRHVTMVDRWPALERAQLLRVSVIRQQLVHGRAALAIAAAEEVGPGRTAMQLHDDAARMARSLAKTSSLGSQPLSHLLYAALHRRVDDVARRHLEEALRGFEACDMAGYAAAARWRLGKLIGGDAGRTHVAEAESFFAAEEVVCPERFVAMLAPGVGTLR